MENIQPFGVNLIFQTGKAVTGTDKVPLIVIRIQINTVDKFTCIRLIDDYKKYLTEAGIDSFEIKRRQADDRSRMGVRLATMHRVKGLEFTTVFIVAANKNYIPLKSAVNRTDPAEREAAMASERCLLYVAMTRAKKKVMLSAYGAVSDFVG